ncbi:MAG: hypothetical protein II907_05880 [Firmicutes bacterium]|nr:hypothetical protein [Bacillota bacterium]
MKKIFLITFLICLLACGVSYADSAATPISSPEDLLLLVQNPDGDFVLTEDIYLPDLQAEPFFEWTPPVFRGHLDGQGHTIYNVRNTDICSETSTVYDGNYKEYDGEFAGLFGILDGAVVENLNLVGANILWRDDFPGDRGGCVFAGLMTGLMENGAVVRNCSVQGSCEVSTSGHCFGVGGIAGYGSGRIENSSADAVLICVDKDKEYKDEQFMGGAYSAGFIDIVDCDIKIDGYDSDHGYVHNGGLVGMYIIYPKGTSYAGQVLDTHVSGRIRFFEDNRDRRAYCAPYIGEVLQWTYDWGGCTENFLRDEVFTYDEDLVPCEHQGTSSWTAMVVEPYYGMQGYTEYTCEECGYTVRTDYKAPLKQEFRVLKAPVLDEKEEAVLKKAKGLPLPLVAGIGACVLLVFLFLATRKKGKH